MKRRVVIKRCEKTRGHIYLKHVAGQTVTVTGRYQSPLGPVIIFKLKGLSVIPKENCVILEKYTMPASRRTPLLPQPAI